MPLIEQKAEEARRKKAWISMLGLMKKVVFNKGELIIKLISIRNNGPYMRDSVQNKKRSFCSQKNAVHDLSFRTS
jgi:hypothetical protein